LAPSCLRFPGKAEAARSRATRLDEGNTRA
jgi:hypothetical protein